MAFYTPPLFETGKRNIIEKIIDFSGFSWHLSKSAFYRVFIRKDISKMEFAKAAWYRVDYFPKLMNVCSSDLFSIAEAYEEKALDDFVKKLYSYFLKESINDVKLLKKIEAFFLEKENWKCLKLASEKILLLDSGDLDSLYYAGLSHLNLNELEKSKEFFERIVSLRPDFADVYYRLGLIYLKKKNYDKAEKLFEQAIEILPNHLDALLRLKWIYEKIK